LWATGGPLAGAKGPVDVLAGDLVAAGYAMRVDAEQDRGRERRRRRGAPVSGASGCEPWLAGCAGFTGGGAGQGGEQVYGPGYSPVPDVHPVAARYAAAQAGSVDTPGCNPMLFKYGACPSERGAAGTTTQEVGRLGAAATQQPPIGQLDPAHAVIAEHVAQGSGDGVEMERASSGQPRSRSQSGPSHSTQTQVSCPSR
jgi:hypothetical protein